MGRDFPVLQAIGNHDLPNWFGEENSYSSHSRKRMERTGLSEYCVGEIGVGMLCSYKGVMIYVGSPGLYGFGHGTSIFQAFQLYGGQHRVCAFHWGQESMQTGAKSDETGWEVYEACEHSGAAIFMGHTHSFGRTYKMTEVEEGEFVVQDPMRMDIPATVIVQSGLGGTLSFTAFSLSLSLLTIS